MSDKTTTAAKHEKMKLSERRPIPYTQNCEHGKEDVTEK
jgi:hypothetical protein